MKFSYITKTKRGELQTGIIEAGSRETAVATLQGYGLVVLRLEEEAIVSWQDKLFAWLRRASVKELALFTRQFATLLEAEVPMADSLRTLFSQTENVFLKEAAFDLVSEVEAGAPLSQALARHPKIFSHFYVEMVRSAEITGRLQEVLRYLAEYLESQARLNAKITNATIYPAFVFALFGVVIVMMARLVIPQLKSVFLETGVEFSTLPFFTRLLISFSDFLPRYGLAFLVTALVGTAAFFKYFRSPEGQDLIDLFLFKIPIVGSLARMVYLARLTETTGVMISGDISVPQAIEIAADVAGNPRYRVILREAATAVRRGDTLSEAFMRYPKDLPPLVAQMTAIGEKTGRIDDLLRKVGAFYTQELDAAMANLTELLQPLLIVILGIFVGLLIGAIILPIYQLAQVF